MKDYLLAIHTHPRRNYLLAILVCLGMPFLALWHLLRYGCSMFGSTNSGDASGAIGGFMMWLTTIIGIILWAAILGAGWLVWAIVS